MKKITFTPIVREEALQVRSNREQLIADIVNATTEKNKKSLAKLISIRANEMKWTEMDLHGLLKKRTDPTIRNFTAFVKWSIKTKQV
jgi:hypothetical protein